MATQAKHAATAFGVASFAAMAALFVVIVLLASMASGAPHHSASLRKCFPAAKWNDQERYRPCVEIARVYEDGSFQFTVTDAGGTVRYSSGVGALDR